MLNTTLILESYIICRHNKLLVLYPLKTMSNSLHCLEEFENSLCVNYFIQICILEVLCLILYYTTVCHFYYL